MLEFFEKVVFERKVRKVVDPNAGYSGQIGIAAPGSALRKGKGRKKNPKSDVSIAITTEQVESTLSQLDSDIEAIGSGNEKENENDNDNENENENENDNKNENRISNGNNNDDDAPGSEDDAGDLSLEEQHSADATAELLISSITEKNQGMYLHADTQFRWVYFSFIAID